MTITVGAGVGDDGVAGEGDTVGGDVERIVGTKFNDTITGGPGDDLITAGRGNDVVSGGAGDDYLSGSSGNDTLTGDSGEDVLSGSSGDDVLNAADGEHDVLFCGRGVDVTNDDGPLIDFIRSDCES